MTTPHECKVCVRRRIQKKKDMSEAKCCFCFPHKLCELTNKSLFKCPHLPKVCSRVITRRPAIDVANVHFNCCLCHPHSGCELEDREQAPDKPCNLGNCPVAIYHSEGYHKKPADTCNEARHAFPHSDGCPKNVDEPAEPRIHRKGTCVVCDRNEKPASPAGWEEQFVEISEQYGGSPKLWKEVYAATREAVREAEKRGFREAMQVIKDRWDAEFPEKSIEYFLDSEDKEKYREIGNH
jgi:hypothetical protein